MSNASDFIIENGVLKKYVGPGGDIIIPDGVTSIGKESFFGCANITSITVPKGVTKIGSSAFKDCTNLTNIVLPEGVTRIGESEFENCTSLINIDIPQGVTGIANAAFWNCTNLTSVVLPVGVTSIGYYVFSGCKKLTNIDIPKSMTSIGNCAFECCTSLTDIDIPQGVTYIGKDAFMGCEKLKKVKLPVALGAYLNNFLEASDGLQIHIADLSAIPAKYRPCAALCFAEDGALPEDPRFENHSKYLMANVGKLVDLAAKSPKLLALLCREKWIKVKDADAFLAAAQQTGNAETVALMLDYQNTKLSDKEKEKEQRRKEKEENTVYDRMAARVNLQGVEGLNFVVDGNLYTFESKDQLKKMITKKGGKLQTSISAKTDYLVMRNLQANTAKQKKATELGIEVITEYQLNDKLGRTFEVKRGVLTEYLGAGGDVTIPKRVTSIGNSAFLRCKDLTSVVIPQSVTSIGNCAFEGCTNLTSIKVPEGVSVGDYAFYGCKKLGDADGLVIVQGKLFDYSGTGGDVVIPNGVTEIGGHAFEGCTNLTGIILEGVTSIGYCAFKGCEKLASVVIPKGVTSIGFEMFAGCESLTDIVIPESVTSIGNCAFEGCKNLTGIVIPAGVTSIGFKMFAGCESLTDIVIPESVTSISWAFWYYDRLTIHAPAGSYAEQYAKEHNISFVAE